MLYNRVKRKPNNSSAHHLLSRSILLSITVLFVCLLCLATASYAVSIRVLILDESYKSVPELKDIRKVGNVMGTLLFKGTEYSGRIELFKNDHGLFVVNELPLEEYVMNVVKAEVGEDWPYEALKAQAVVVRTYALYNMLHSHNGIYHLTSSSLSQQYKGVISDPMIDRAVRATEGEILTYNGEPINAMYHSTSGGVTELPEEIFSTSFPYLTSVKVDCTSSPYYIWERRIPLNELEQLLPAKGIKNIEIITRTKTGRAKEVRVYSDGEETVMAVKELRKVLGWKRLPSTWFSISKNEDLIIFNGKGYGHGVGMCQWSSKEMAEKGTNYKDILSLFYPNTVIQLHEDK